MTGKEAVSWMILHLPIRDREEATQVGTKLMQRGYIQSLMEEKTFKDSETSFYVFQVRILILPKLRVDGFFLLDGRRKSESINIQSRHQTKTRRSDGLI